MRKRTDRVSGEDAFVREEGEDTDATHNEWYQDVGRVPSKLESAPSHSDKERHRAPDDDEDTPARCNRFASAFLTCTAEDIKKHTPSPFA